MRCFATSTILTLLATPVLADCALNPNAGNGVFPDDEVICRGVDPDGLTIDLASINGRGDNTLRVLGTALVEGPLDVSNAPNGSNDATVNLDGIIRTVSRGSPAVTLRDVEGILSFSSADISALGDAFVIEGFGSSYLSHSGRIEGGTSGTGLRYASANALEPADLFLRTRLSNSGTIVGGVGVEALGRRDAEIINHGVIEGTRGTAVRLGPTSELRNEFLTPTIGRASIVGRRGAVDTIGEVTIENDGEIRSTDRGSITISMGQGLIRNLDRSDRMAGGEAGFIGSTAVGATAIQLIGLGTGTVKVENEGTIYGSAAAIDGTLNLFSDVALDYVGTGDGRLISNDSVTMRLGRRADSVLLLDRSELDGESLLGAGDDSLSLGSFRDLVFGGFGGLGSVALADGQTGKDTLNFLEDRYQDLDFGLNGYGVGVRSVFDLSLPPSDELWFRSFENITFRGDSRIYSLQQVLDGAPALAPVPLPAGGWLLLAALGGLALRRRR